MKDGHLPTELDFFKYTHDAGQKRKSKSDELGGRKKRRRQESDSEGEEDAEDQGDAGSVVGAEEQPVAQRHQVKTKGSNVPPHFETFEDLRTRYLLSSHISSSLEKYGYSRPTSVQSYAIPILLEVSWYSLCGPHTGVLIYVEPRSSCNFANGYRKDPLIPSPHIGRPRLPELKREEGFRFWSPCGRTRAYP